MIRTLLLSLLLLSVLAKSSSKKAAVLHIQPIDLTLDQSKDIKFTNLNESKALMINIEQSKFPGNFSEFEVRITSQGSADSLCVFKYGNNLCVLERPSKEALVRVKCTSNRCQTSLVFSHRSVIRTGDPDSKKKLSISGQIYHLSKHRFNTILQIYAQREQHKMLSEQITIFSNIHAFSLQQVEELDTNSAIFGLKPIKKEMDQYIFIESQSQGSEKFKVVVKTHNGELRDGINVVDFVENFNKHTHNNYTFMGEMRKNMQINVRVFSPRDPKGLPFELIVMGKKSEQEEFVEFRWLRFNPLEFDDQKFFDFTFAISKEVHSLYKTILIQVLLNQVQDRYTFFELGVSDVDAFSINIFDHVFFGCNKKETLHFAVSSQVQMQLSDGDKDIQLLTNANQKYFSNVQSCSLHKGCDIQILTENDCSNCSFKFDLRDQDIRNHIIYYDVKDDTIEGKVDLQEEIYFKYVMNGKAASQIIVNSMNVIIYANFDNYKRCKIPTAACHQYAINQQNPVVVHNEEQQPVQLIIGVVGLEKTSFKVRFLNQINGLQVKLGEKFSYLMDDEEKELEVRYVLGKEDLAQMGEHLHFNLISPIHSMRITVSNEGQKVESVDGYLSFDKKSIKGDLFLIKIQKINLYYNEYVHFTLVITTSDVPVRLDSTTTHYQKYGSQSVKKFLIEYEPSDSNAINIYTQNLQKEKGSMILTVRDSKASDEEAKPILTRKLARDYEFIDLDDELQMLDICDDVNCELQITIKNEGKTQFQQSITLMKQQSVISLDDSIWSVFEINELSRRNHFYFIPRHQNKSITILFNTDDNHLFVNYLVFNYSNSINPADWPFGHESTAEVGHISNSQEIIITGNDPEILACWPTCAILINVNEGFQKEENPILEHSVIKSYKILATNSILELPEDTKLDFTLRSEEEKVLFILTKDILKYEKLTFFTYYSFGRGRITATLFNNDMEYQIDEKPFVFEQLETSLPLYKILAVISREKLNTETVLIKITIKAETILKMTMEYSSFVRDVYRVRMDDLEVCSLKKGQEIFYQILPERDFSLKLYRVKGFPLMKIIKCKEQNYIKCFSQDKKYLQLKAKEFEQTQATLKQNLEKEIATNEEPANSTNELEVFVEKSFDFSQERCDNCIYFLWIYCFEGDLEMTINLRTKYSEVELKEMAVLSERLNAGKYYRYLINRLHDKDTIVTMKILEGAAKVEIVESSHVIYNETLDSVNNDYRDFVLEADEEEQEEEDEEEEQDNSFGQLKKSNNQHIFKHAHVTVTTLSEKPVEFLISYSVGASSIYLQDGIVLEKSMTANSRHTFFYRNKNKKERAYLSLSSELLRNESPNATNTIHVNFYYYPDAGNRKVKENFQPELPPSRNQNYLGDTISRVYELPSKYELYEVQVEATSNQKIIASINHQQLVYLPLGFEYFIKLHERENLNLVIDRPNSEYLEVRIKKCDTSTPSLQYTNDARQFKKGIFEAEVDIDSSHFKQYIQTKKSSKTIHLQLIGSLDSESLLTISVQSSSKEQKLNTMNFKAGNKGVIDYKMVQTNLVEVSFKPITCDNKECSVPFNYYLVIAGSLEEIYGQLNCANTFFIPDVQKMREQKKAKTEIIMLNRKHLDKQTGEYKYRLKLQEKQEFLGVKGVMEGSKEEVQYLPVEIRDIWGELSKISFGIVIMVSLALALLFTVVIVVSTKLARRGYKPIAGSE